MGFNRKGGSFGFNSPRMVKFSSCSIKDMKQKTESRDIDCATLVLRLALGIFFLVAGTAQILSINGFMNTVSGFAIVDNALPIASLQGVLFPWIEIILGFMLIFGIVTSLAGLLVAFLSFLFAASHGFVEGSSLVKEILFIAVGLALMLLGGGRFSLDARLRRKLSQSKKV